MAQKGPERGAKEKKGETSSFDILSLPQAASLLGVHRNTLYRLIQDEAVPAFRLSRGGHWKFRKDELEEWLKDKEARGVLI